MGKIFKGKLYNGQFKAYSTKAKHTSRRNLSSGLHIFLLMFAIQTKLYNFDVNVIEFRHGTSQVGSKVESSVSFI